MSAPGQARMPSTAYFVGRLIAYRPQIYALKALCWILFHAWPLALGLVAKAFFDALTGKAPAGLTLESIVALVLALGLARVAIVYGTALAGPRFGFQAAALLHRNIFARMLEHPGAKGASGSVGEAISTLRDDVDVMSLMTDWPFDATAGLIFAGGGIAILLRVSVRVTLLVFVPMVAVIALAYLVRARLEGTRARSRAATARVTGAIGEIFGAVQAIQVAGAEDAVIAHLRRLGNERQKAMLRDHLQGLWLNAIFQSTASLGAGLTLLVAASAMRSGAFTVGDFALFATYLMQVAGYTGFFGYLINTYRQSGVAFQRAVALLQGAPAASLVAHQPVYLSGPLPALPAVVKTVGDRLETLEVAGLTFHHPMSGRGVDDVSFTLRRGSFTVITGRIGAGKTTLLKAVLGLLEQQTGEVRWNGRKVDTPRTLMVPPRVAYTPQTPTLLSGTLRENILLGIPDDDRLARALSSAVLERDLATFAEGLDTRVGARGVRLAGGQGQRVAAARMFVREPELLVCDDLSSALDSETERLLWRRTLDLGATCLIVSHHRAALEHADQILVLEEGRIAARGTLASLQLHEIWQELAPLLGPVYNKERG